MKQTAIGKNATKKLYRHLALPAVAALLITACHESPPAPGPNNNGPRTGEQEPPLAETKTTKPRNAIAEKPTRADVLFNAQSEGAVEWTVDTGEAEVIREGEGKVIVRLESTSFFRLTSSPGPIGLPPASGLGFKPNSEDSHSLSIIYTVYKKPTVIGFVWFEYSTDNSEGPTKARLFDIPMEAGTHEILAEVPLSENSIGFRVALQLSDREAQGEVSVDEILLLRER
ncbi:MAG: hypothetical protein ACJZ7Z_01855 [Myxococcota bacterium]